MVDSDQQEGSHLRVLAIATMFVLLASGAIAPAAAMSPFVVSVDPASGILMAFIEDPGNTADTSGLGAVDHRYRLAVHEVTNTEYVEFLNAVAASDPNGLYADIMTDSDRGGILRNGSPGSYAYSIKPSFEDKPANGFSWYDAARFCNWLHNGKPSGAQGPSTTEDGAYDVSLPGDQIVRKAGARYFIPTHDEWYKAAYYDPFDAAADGGGSPDYWFYPTRSDIGPTLAQADAFGDVTNPGPNVANMDKGAAWNGESGNVTTVGGTTSISPWGLVDMAGNVNEPTETPGTPIQGNPPLPTRRLRGGDFSNPTALAASPAGFSGSLNMLAEAANIGIRIGARACNLPPDPSGLTVGKDGLDDQDALLSWSAGGSATWNVYRDATPDPTSWGGPHAGGVTDEDPVANGIQYSDPGVLGDTSPYHYLITGLNSCGDSPLF